MIKYYIKRGRYGFGRERAYVVAPHDAPLSQLTGRTTLYAGDIEALHELGLKTKEVTTVNCGCAGCPGHPSGSLPAVCEDCEI